MILAAGQRSFVAALAVSMAYGCAHVPGPDPRYVLGPPYQAQAVWYYPRETYELNETGLAAVAGDSHARLTTDGEIFDQAVLAAAHPTLQLPALAQVTNLENGRQVTVRVNDRGTGNPGRLVEITRRAATLLGIAQTAVTPVRMQVLPGESRAAAEALPGAPSLAIAVAPRGSVDSAALAPPPGVRSSFNQASEPKRPVAADRSDPPAPAPRLRLPETVRQTPPEATLLMVRLDTFDTVHYAAVQRAKMRSADARIVSIVEGRTRRYQVEIGPLRDVSRADAVLEQALASGIPDARIVVVARGADMMSASR